MKVACENQLMFEDGTILNVDMVDDFWRPWFSTLVILALELQNLLDHDVTAFCCLSALSLLMHGSFK